MTHNATCHPEPACAGRRSRGTCFFFDEHNDDPIAKAHARARTLRIFLRLYSPL